MIQRSHLAIVVLALAGALGGFLAGRWLHPGTPAPSLQDAALVGSAAPPLRLPDPAGRVRSLDEWKGRLVLVNFWASWCAPCVAEMPLLDRFGRERAAQGWSVVGIAADGAGPTRAFLARHPVGYPILIDDPEAPGRARDASQSYGNRHDVLPYSVLVDRSGHIVAQHAGSFTEATLRRWIEPFR